MKPNYANILEIVQFCDVFPVLQVMVRACQALVSNRKVPTPSKFAFVELHDLTPSSQPLRTLSN